MFQLDAIHAPYKQILLLEELLSSLCLREDLKDGTYKGYTKLQMMTPIVLVHKYGVSLSAVIYQCLIYLSVNNAVEYLLPLS